jgi:hypothetical protein
MTRMPGGYPLVGVGVRLDPTDEADAPALFAALDHDEVWSLGYAGGPSARPTTADGWRRRNQRTHLGWTAYSPVSRPGSRSCQYAPATALSPARERLRERVSACACW